MKKIIRAKKEIGREMTDYQKWVDYDMKHYGKISDVTMGKIKRAGLSVVKDQYGDYEVIGDDKIDSGCHGKKKEKVMAAIDKYELNDEIWGLLHAIKDMRRRIDNIFDEGVVDKYIREVLNRVYSELTVIYGEIDDIAD